MAPPLAREAGVIFVAFEWCSCNLVLLAGLGVTAALLFCFRLVPSLGYIPPRCERWRNILDGMSALAATAARLVGLHYHWWSDEPTNEFPRIVAMAAVGTASI